jgi:hypothetical protein
MAPGLVGRYLLGSTRRRSRPDCLPASQGGDSTYGRTSAPQKARPATASQPLSPGSATVVSATRPDKGKARPPAGRKSAGGDDNSEPRIQPRENGQRPRR